MVDKKCFKCNQIKPLSDYYKHPQMGDGHLNKCKDCTKKDTKERLDRKLKEPEFLENERSRHREKYYRLDYREKHRPSPDQKKISTQKYRDRYPEKYHAKIASQKINCINGERHHWSYNKEHYKDVIYLSVKDHAKAHRFIVYDQERMMYRRSDKNELLDTKESHIEWIEFCIKNKPD